MKKSIVNPLIEPIARAVYRAKQSGQTWAEFGAVDPLHIEVEYALKHFNAMPHTKAVLRLSAYGKYHVRVSWLNFNEGK
jgi:hypothetical protein